LILLGLAASAGAQVPRDPFGDQPWSESPAATSPPPPPSPAPGAASQLPAPYVTRQSDVEIPFSVRPGTTPESQPSAVRVFVSWDRGKSWHLFEEHRPEDGRFRFRPKQDGEFWFATQTIDRSGRPDNPEPRQPQLRLVVDTQRPQLLVQAQVRGADEVAVSWSAADATLNPATLKIEYQDAGASGPWEAVSLPSAGGSSPGQTQGQTSFKPLVASRSINLRAEIADTGGNVAYFSQRLSLAAPKAKAPGELAYAPAPDPSATRWTPDGDRPAVASNEDVRIPNAVDNPFLRPGRMASTPAPAVPASPSHAAQEWPLASARQPTD
jgi:hypothetical protein